MYLRQIALFHDNSGCLAEKAKFYGPLILHFSLASTNQYTN